MVVVILANNLDCIQAAVVLHPGPMTEDEINGNILHILKFPWVEISSPPQAFMLDWWLL